MVASLERTGKGLLADAFGPEVDAEASRPSGGRPAADHQISKSRQWAIGAYSHYGWRRAMARWSKWQARRPLTTWGLASMLGGLVQHPEGRNSRMSPQAL